jgi:phage shock protein A
MTQETAVLEEREPKQKRVRTTEKRLTAKNVWDELEVLRTKIDTMEAIIDASNHAKLGPEMLGEEPATDKILSKLHALEEKLSSVDSIGTKLDTLGARLEEPAVAETETDTADETATGKEVEAQFEALGKKIDLLSEELKAAREKAEAKPSEEPAVWSGVFSVGASVAAGGAILSAIPSISIIAAIGLVCVGGFLSAISALRLWFSPAKQEEPVS